MYLHLYSSGIHCMQRGNNGSAVTEGRPKEGNSARASVKNAVKHQTFRLVSQNFSGEKRQGGEGGLACQEGAGRE